jgi:hypothetical protein
MLEKFNQLAAAAATKVSRRQFLDRVGRGAMVVVAAAGGLLAISHDASAAAPVKCGPDQKPCWIVDENGKRFRSCCPRGPIKK